MPNKLIVGFGNPGDDLKDSRHNIGFNCIDYVAEKLKVPYKFDKKKSIYGKKKINGEEIIVLKPQTFSNLSGEAVLYIASFLKVEVQDIFVIYDDINRPFGTVEIEENLENIVHNAVSHLAESLQDDSFIKCAFGIGPIPKGVSEEDFYLSNFKEKEEKEIPALIDAVYKTALTSFSITDE